MLPGQHPATPILVCKVAVPGIKPWGCGAGLLNLMYDAMPADYVTLIATEFGAIPPTSVPVILREYRQEPCY